MKYYLDINLFPDAEANLGFIWQKVYQKIHLALVEMKTPDGNSAIAVSFPEYGEKFFPLGSTLRLLAPSHELLQQLDIAKLNCLHDYIHCKAIEEIPRSVTFARFKRHQFNINPERLARRRAKRKGESLEQALQHYADFKDKTTRLPFLNVTSLSNGNKFRLFIGREKIAQPVVGEFNCYGLSSRDFGRQATVPWF